MKVYIAVDFEGGAKELLGEIEAAATKRASARTTSLRSSRRW